ncbi:hypothetical protein D3C73_1566420 [compost metagenome]
MFGRSYDYAANDVAVPADILADGMNDEIDAEFKRILETWRCPCIVNDRHGPNALRQAGERAQILKPERQRRRALQIH